MKSAVDCRLLVAPPAQRSLDRLPAAAAVVAVEFLLGDLLRERRRVGKPLRAELAGTWSARHGPYRVVYSIDEPAGLVAVLQIDHRADVYRSRRQRRCIRRENVRNGTLHPEHDRRHRCEH
ncbi:MAG: type II toxin-antitoxin system RelE/ParE family toxin, partial [Sporichthyaceae bacterium]|nr:type II toxin-antitoxin system RelE/ParE family toxin [Sporichthyaceae bacterium]